MGTIGTTYTMILPKSYDRSLHTIGIRVTTGTCVTTDTTILYRTMTDVKGQLKGGVEFEFFHSEFRFTSPEPYSAMG